MTVFFAALSAVLYGTADFSGGFAARKNPVLAVMLLSQPAGLLLGLLGVPLLGWSAPSGNALFWGGLSGASGAVGLFMLYRGLAQTVVAVVSPVSAFVGALVPMLFGLALGERPSPVAAAGALLCLPAILLLSYEKPGAENEGAARKAVLYGAIAGLGFGGFFIAVSRAGAGTGLWPLIASRSVSLLFFLCAAAVMRTRISVAAGSVGIVLLAGVCDMGANIAFLFAVRSGLLVLATIVTSLFPAPTVILARIFMGERLRPMRIAGLALALAGAAMIGAG
jgi:drug/metabolite transporter (DMT)-like permease